MRKNLDITTTVSDVHGSQEGIYAEYKKRFGPLGEFITDYEFAKGIQKLSQAEIAQRAGTTQSAISRFEAMKHPPTYDLLVRISQALGETLFLSPFGSLSITLPYDLHEKARRMAAARGMSVQDLLYDYIRKGFSQAE